MGACILDLASHHSPRQKHRMLHLMKVQVILDQLRLLIPKVILLRLHLRSANEVLELTTAQYFPVDMFLLLFHDKDLSHERQDD